MKQKTLSEKEYYPADEVVAEIESLLEVVKAVAHIGIDFGHGKFELDESHIKLARQIMEKYND